MKKYLIIVFAALCIRPVFAQVDVTAFPDGVHMQPFIANFLEPRMGFHFDTEGNDLRLDIGTSRDLVKLELPANNTLTIGADFFTYTRLRADDDFHFPVDAVDYLFGLNAVWTQQIPLAEIGMRFRLSHISAHLVDGHYDFANQEWRDREPIVYSREFAELFPFVRVGSFRFYGGMTYIFNTTPDIIGEFIFQAGVENMPEFSIGPLQPFLAYDIRTEEIGKFKTSHTLMAGFKIGHPRDAGLSVIATYYAGRNLHGEYYDLHEEKFSIGFNIDL